MKIYRYTIAHMLNKLSYESASACTYYLSNCLWCYNLTLVIKSFKNKMGSNM